MFADNDCFQFLFSKKIMFLLKKATPQKKLL